MHFEMFEELLTKPMTRKEFLVHVGVLLFALTGIAGLLTTLSNPHVVGKHTILSTGFGGGRYGG